MVNINEKNGHGLLQKCPVLLDYSKFVETVRECKKKDPENGIRDAVERCIREGILSTYLRRKGSEVINMLTAEYSYEEDIAENRDEAVLEGVIRGTGGSGTDEKQLKGFTKEICGSGESAKYKRKIRLGEGPAEGLSVVNGRPSGGSFLYGKVPESRMEKMEETGRKIQLMVY